MNALTDIDRLAVMAWVDGELPPADQAAFDARLAREPALASAVARERALRASLQAAYAPVLDEPVPAGASSGIARRSSSPAGTDSSSTGAYASCRRVRSARSRATALASTGSCARRVSKAA